MSRGQQTAWIVGAILIVGVILAYVMWPAPNLDGLTRMQKCEHRSFYKNRGGSIEACKKQIVEESYRRLMSR